MPKLKEIPIEKMLDLLERLVAELHHTEDEQTLRQCMQSMQSGNYPDWQIYFDPLLSIEKYLRLDNTPKFIVDAFDTGMERQQILEPAKRALRLETLKQEWLKLKNLPKTDKDLVQQDFTD